MVGQGPVQSGSVENYLEWAHRGKPDLWRYTIAVVLGFVLSLYVLPIFFGVLLAVQKVFEISQQGVLLLSFFPGLVFILLLVRLLLVRPAWSVALPSWPPSGRMLLVGLLIGLLVGLAPPPFVHFQFEGFAALRSTGPLFISLTLAGLLVQTAMEEILFRGLIQQAAFRVTGRAWPAILIQALIFGILHISNIGAWNNNPLAMLPYLVTALSWGWIAARTGSLLVPWMLHFTNNASTTFIVGVRGDVLHSIGPFSIEPPTLDIAILISFMQAALWVGLVEIYVRRAMPKPRTP